MFGFLFDLFCVAFLLLTGATVAYWAHIDDGRVAEWIRAVCRYTLVVVLWVVGLFGVDVGAWVDRLDKQSSGDSGVA